MTARRTRTRPARRAKPTRKKPERPPKPVRCKLQHVVPPPDIAQYQAAMLPVSADTLDYIIETQLVVPGLTRQPQPRFLRGIDNMWTLDRKLGHDVCEWSYADDVPPSPEVTVTERQYAMLQPGTEKIRTLDDGRIVVPGTSGNCTTPASVLHGAWVRYASMLGLGFNFAAGLCWWMKEDFSTGHAMGWAVNDDLRWRLYQPGRPFAEAWINPEDQPENKIWFIYQA